MAYGTLEPAASHGNKTSVTKLGGTLLLLLSFCYDHLKNCPVELVDVERNIVFVRCKFQQKI